MSKKKKSRAPRVAIVSLGCAKNTVDSENALGELAEGGFELTGIPADADIILINTCGFIESARDESMNMIDTMLDLKGQAGFPKVLAMGCFSQKNGEEIAAARPELDGVLGLDAAGKLSEVCEKVLGGTIGAEVYGRRKLDAAMHEGVAPRLLSTPPSYAYLRIADGCDNNCTYCSIPSIRGRLASRKMEDIVTEAVELAAGGVYELNVIAQDTTAYGTDIYGQPQFVELLENLLSATDILDEKPIFRILYTHPARVERELMELIASSGRICNYMDMPIQHVSGRILKAMNRGYDSEFLMNKLQMMREVAPEVVLRTSLICGFPGETEDEFSELLNFVKSGYFKHLGAFAYSQEEQTPAASIGGEIPAEVAKKRVEAIMQAQSEVAFKWLDSRLGSTVDVVADDEISTGVWACRSEYEAPEVDGEIIAKSANIYSGMKFRACLKTRQLYDIEACIDKSSHDLDMG